MSSLIIPFLTGGVIVSGVKYAASTLKNPKLAALIGAFPIGLFSIYFLTSTEAHQYGFNYAIMTTILLSSVIFFNILFQYLQFSKPVAYLAGIVFYFVMAAIHFF